MANAVFAMSGPTKIIELDGKPRSSWRLEKKALHLWKGKLWRLVEAGCFFCAEEAERARAEGLDVEGFVTFTRDHDDGTPESWCMDHGELHEIPYSMEKKFKIVIGGVTREGETSCSDVMLFPVSMSEDERNEAIESLLGELEADEVSAGPAPTSEDYGDDDDD